MSMPWFLKIDLIQGFLFRAFFLFLFSFYFSGFAIDFSIPPKVSQSPNGATLQFELIKAGDVEPVTNCGHRRSRTILMASKLQTSPSTLMRR